MGTRCVSYPDSVANTWRVRWESARNDLAVTILCRLPGPATLITLSTTTSQPSRPSHWDRNHAKSGTTGTGFSNARTISWERSSPLPMNHDPRRRTQRRSETNRGDAWGPAGATVAHLGQRAPAVAVVEEERMRMEVLGSWRMRIVRTKRVQMRSDFKSQKTLSLLSTLRLLYIFMERTELQLQFGSMSLWSRRFATFFWQSTSTSFRRDRCENCGDVLKERFHRNECCDNSSRWPWSPGYATGCVWSV